MNLGKKLKILRNELNNNAMAKFRVVYENLAGQTKVTYVNDQQTVEDAENYVLCNNPDVLQVLDVSRA